MTFFKKKWERLLIRADKAFSGERWADAYYLYEETRQVAPSSHFSEIEKKRALAQSFLREEHREMALQYESTSNAAGARERWELALQFSMKDTDRNEAEEHLRALAVAEVEAAEVAVSEEAQEDIPQPVIDKRHTFMMLIGDMPDAIIDRYEAQDDAFIDAFMAVQEGHADAGLEYFQREYEESQEPVLCYEYGQCLLSLQQAETAIGALIKAVELAPDWMSPKLSLTRACWAESRFELAEETLQDALELEEENLDVLAAVCQTALLTSSPQYGLEAAELALELAPNHRELLLLKGKLHQQMEESSEALDCFEKLIQTHWRFDNETGQVIFDREAGVLATRIYVREGRDLDRAEELTRAALAVSSPREKWQFELLLGRVLLADGREEEARNLLLETERRIPEDELLGQLRAAELLGDQKKISALLPRLNEDEKARWESRRDRVKGTSD